mmetsp:Transcript_7198/g.25716  ORF Transcript_7198/g.25716 Transcript_7198/m.25716 type:complete len:247 (+) Transcript_7198:550-1290(+)
MEREALAVAPCVRRRGGGGGVRGVGVQRSQVGGSGHAAAVRGVRGDRAHPRVSALVELRDAGGRGRHGRARRLLSRRGGRQPLRRQSGHAHAAGVGAGVLRGGPCVRLRRPSRASTRRRRGRRACVGRRRPLADAGAPAGAGTRRALREPRDVVRALAGGRAGRVAARGRDGVERRRRRRAARRRPRRRGCGARHGAPEAAAVPGGAQPRDPRDRGHNVATGALGRGAAADVAPAARGGGGDARRA